MSLLNDAGDTVRDGHAEHEKGCLRHSDDEVSRDGDGQREGGPRSPRSERHLDEEQQDREIGVRAAELIVAVEEEEPTQGVRGTRHDRRHREEAKDAREDEGGERTEDEGAHDREVPDALRGMEVHCEQERVERRALHVGGLRRARPLVGIPERQLALRVRLLVHARPRLERPGGRALIGSEVGRVVGRRLSGEGSRAGDAGGALSRRAERAASEDHWCESDQDERATHDRAGDVRAANAPAATARVRATRPRRRSRRRRRRCATGSSSSDDHDRRTLRGSDLVHPSERPLVRPPELSEREAQAEIAGCREVAQTRHCGITVAEGISGSRAAAAVDRTVRRYRRRSGRDARGDRWRSAGLVLTQARARSGRSPGGDAGEPCHEGHRALEHRARRGAHVAPSHPREARTSVSPTTSPSKPSS